MRSTLKCEMINNTTKRHCKNLFERCASIEYAEQKCEYDTLMNVVTDGASGIIFLYVPV